MTTLRRCLDMLEELSEFLTCIPGIRMLIEPWR